MTVAELIEKLKEMPQGAEVKVHSETLYGYESPNPEQIWNDNAENYLVVL